MTKKWEQVRGEVEDLYFVQNKPLVESSGTRSYRQKIKEWNFKKEKSCNATTLSTHDSSARHRSAVLSVSDPLSLINLHMGDTPNPSTLCRSALAVANQTYAENVPANATPPRQVLGHSPVSVMKDFGNATYSFEEDVQSTEMSGGSPRLADWSVYNWIDWDGDDFGASQPEESTLQTDISAFRPSVRS